jgi:glyoxylase I family protein
MKIEVSGIDHIYVAVSDLRRSEAFYDGAMRLLGFRKGTTPIGGEPHLHYFNRATQYTIRPAKRQSSHDPYSTGLHHVCFRVDSPQIVDAVWEGLRSLGIDASPPQLYPEYAPDYYATFFQDPDGIRLEVVALRRLRSLIREHWDDLTEFENPLSKADLL